MQLRGYLKLFKFRIVALLVFTAIVSAVVASDGVAPIDRIAILVVSGGLASIGSAFLNHYFDRDIDALVTRTRDRPIPAGEVNPSTVLYLGLFLIASSLLISSTLNYVVPLFIFLGAFTYVVVYTVWLKRRSPLNIVLGGLSGAFAALAGWATVSTQLSVTPLFIAWILFLWTPSHFWSFAIVQRESYEKARVPMLPVVLGVRRASRYILLNTLTLSAISVLLYFVGPFGPIYLTVSLALGVIFVYWGIRLVANSSKAVAWENYKFSGLYLVVLLSAMLLDVLG